MLIFKKMVRMVRKSFCERVMFEQTVGLVKESFIREKNVLSTGINRVSIFDFTLSEMGNHWCFEQRRERI